MPITFLDEEDNTGIDDTSLIPSIQPKKRKVTFLDEEPEEEIGTLQGIANSAQNAFDSSKQALLAVGGVDQDQAEQISKLEYAKQARKVAPGYAEYQKAEGMDAVGAFLRNPVEVTTNIIGEGLAGSLTALGAGLTAGAAGAAVGSVVPGIGTGIGFTAGQVAGTFGGSLSTEYGSKILEELQKSGMDITDPNSIQSYFSDEEKLAPIRDKAFSRGVPIAAFDAVSAGIGGKLGRVFGSEIIKEGEKVLGKKFATKTGEALTELGAQAVLGGGGEVAGSVAAGDEVNLKDVFAEVIGEVGTGSIEVLQGKIADRANQRKLIEAKANQDILNLSETLEQNNAPQTARATTQELAKQLSDDLNVDREEEAVELADFGGQTLKKINEVKTETQTATTKEEVAANLSEEDLNTREQDAKKLVQQYKDAYFESQDPNDRAKAVEFQGVLDAIQVEKRKRSYEKGRSAPTQQQDVTTPTVEEVVTPTTGTEVIPLRDAIIQSGIPEEAADIYIDNLKSEGINEDQIREIADNNKSLREEAARKNEEESIAKRDLAQRARMGDKEARAQLEGERGILATPTTEDITAVPPIAEAATLPVEQAPLTQQAVAQQVETQPYATQEIIQPEGVRQEPQDGTQIQPTTETGISDSILGTERSQEEGQVVPTSTAKEPYRISKQPPVLPEANAPATPAVGKPSPTKRISPESATQLQTLGFISNSDPGISIETSPNPPAFGGGWVANTSELERRVVYRDEKGKPKGYLRFYIKEQGSKAVDATEGLEVYVEPEYRRKGIAKQLYTTASQAGYDVMSVSGTGAVSEEGAALSASLKATPSTSTTPAPVAETPAVTEPTPAVSETITPAAPTEFGFVKDIDVDRENIKKNLIRFASGMSGLSDMRRGSYARAGHRNYGVGAVAGLLSKNTINQLADRIINMDVHTFIDSGAFGHFIKEQKLKLEGKTLPPLNFDKILAKYDLIIDEINNANIVERDDYPRPLIVTPDKLGDQNESLNLTEKYKNWIAARIEFNDAIPIIPIPLGQLTLPQAYNRIVEILKTNTIGAEINPNKFIVGIPSNATAVSREDLAKFLQETNHPRIHFLGAAADSKISPLINVVAKVSPNTLVTADASQIRSKIANASKEGKTRDVATFDALYQEDDLNVILESIKEDPTQLNPTQEQVAPAAPTGLQVGQRVRSGSTPQPFVITEVTPQTARDVELGEQYYKIKNERTGEVSVVEEIDVKKIGGNKVRKMAIKEELVGFNNLPKENQKEADSFIGNKGSLWKLENVSVQELMENSMASMTGDTLGDYDIDGLVKSITKEGVKQPITIERNADGSIDLEGNHRVYAAYLAGLDTIPAYVLQKQGILKQVVEEKISKTALIDKDGSIISASDKNHAMLMEESQFNLDNGEFPPVENFGFVTNFGRFVSQKEGQEIAKNSQQVQGSQQISGELVTLINEEDNANVLRLNAQGASGNKFNETGFKRFPGIVVTRTNSETLTSHPLYNAAKKFNNVEAAKIIVDKFVDDQMVFDVFANIDQSKPAYIVPVLKGEGDSLNMLPIALAEKLSAASGIPVWGNLIQATSGQSTGAGVNEKTEISRKFMGEAPPTGSQIIIVDDYLATGRTIASLENMTGTASAVSTIASGRYGNQYGLTTQRAEKLLEKAGITKERFYEIYGLQPEQAITGVEAQTYILNGAAGESGLTSRFPVEKISPSNERIRNIANVPEAIELFAGGGLFALGVRGIARPGYVVEADQRIAEFYEEAHGVPVIQDYVQNVNFSGVKSGHLQASPVCKNFSGAKNKNQITEADIQLDKTAADSVSRAIEDTQPNTVSIENVKQYKGSDSYNSIITTLEKNGYIYDANIYKANEFGAPTSRERLIVRAVKKGGVLPEIKKTNKRVSWYDSVKDIVNDLPNHDIFKFKYPAKLMQTLERKGIDLFNVREPLLISGMSGESMRWSNEPAFTFLASPRTLNIIALPGGIVKKVTARAMARMTGVPDSFPLPEDEALAKTIIGNGIPPALTRSVIGDLIIKNQKPEVAVPNVAAEKNQYTFDAAEKEVTKFFGEMPKGIVILNNATDPDLQFKAGYDVKTGDIIINLAYINNSENIGDIISHELGHFIFGDPQFRAAFQEFWDTMTPEKKAEADKVISQFYNNETGEIKIEEKQIRAFMQLIQDSNAQPKWKQILDAIKRWINEKLGTNFQVTDRGALAVLAAAHNRFKSGEQIIREINSGVIRTAETAQDAEYLAAVERGDMETAQRMVDEAAKKAGYVLSGFHGSIEKNIKQFKNPTWVAKNENLAERYSEDYQGEDVVEFIQGKVYPVIVNPGKTLKLWRFKDWVDLVEKLAPNNDVLKNEILKNRTNFAFDYTNTMPIFEFDSPNRIEKMSNWAKENRTWDNFKKTTLRNRQEAKRKGEEYFVWNTEGYDLSSTWREDYDPSKSNFSSQIKLVNALFDLGYDTLGQLESGQNASTDAGYLIKNPNQIKSADPVTYDDAGNVIPLSQRFRATSPDIRRMAAETEKRSQVHGQKEAGRILNSFIGGNKIVQDIVRQNYFDSTQFNNENTQKAYDLLQSLIDFTDGNNNAFAIKLNEDIQSKLKDYDVHPDIKQVIGVQILRNELQMYSNKLIISGDPFFDKIYKLNANDIPVGVRDFNAGNAARILSSIAKINNPMIGAIQAQGKGEVVQLASTTFGTKEPSTEQINVIEEALKESGKAETIRNEDVLDSVVSAESKTGVNIRKDIDATIKKSGVKQKTVDDVIGSTETGKTEFAGVDASTAKASIKKQATSPIDAQAEHAIEGLAKLQSDVQAWPNKTQNQVRSIVQQDLRQRPDMARKEAWKSLLTSKLMNAGVSESNAMTLSDLIWKQHEINNMNREIKLIESAAENGSLGVIVEMIKNTPLQQQSTPEWRKEVIRQYLKSAGLSDKQAESAARLYDNIIAEKIAEAKQKAFEDSISKTSPWRDHMSRNGQLAKDALKKVLNAVRTSALDPTQNTESIIAKQNGWTGFSESDFRRIAEIDEILNNKDTDELKKAELMKELNEIISKTKLPVTVKQALAAFYTGQALMGIPTALVNFFSPAGFAIRNLITDIGRFALTDPSRIPIAFDTFLDSMRSWYNQTKYAFKNEVYPNDVVEYLNGNNVLKELYNKGKKEWKNGDYASGMRDMLVGMTQITGRVLSALDQGAISALENQAVNRYAMEAMSLSNIPSSKRNAVARQILQAKRNTYASLIAGGMEKERAGVLADMEMKEQIKKQLSSLNIETEKVNDVINSALNDALLSVGRNRTLSMDGLVDEQKRLSDNGMISYLPIKFLEQIASSSAQQGPLMQIFSKMLYGFALVPARAFHNAAWYSPYGFLRIFRDKYQKSKGMESSYSLSLGNELQYRQRLTESIAGSLVMLGLGALVKSSTDDEDDDKFKIVVTGNGPDAAADKQYYDSWIKKWKPYSIHIVMGDTVIPINIGRGGEAIFFPILIAGALDDWNIRNQMNKAKKKPADLNQATVMLGSAFLALAQRGPYAAFGKSLFNANRAGQLPEEVASQAGYFGKTFIPIVGTSLARNISDFINDPIDRSSMSGAIYSNIPIVGPMIGTKALNAFGQPIRADDWGDKLFKLGVPMVFSFPKNTPMNALNELVLSKGDGPTIPTRRIAESRLERPMTNEEFYAYVKTYGDSVSKSMFRSRKSLERMDASRYQSQLEEYSKDANERATRVVKRMSMR